MSVATRDAGSAIADTRRMHRVLPSIAIAAASEGDPPPTRGPMPPLDRPHRKPHDERPDEQDLPGDDIPDVPGSEPPPVPIRDPLPDGAPDGPMIA